MPGPSMFSEEAKKGSKSHSFLTIRSGGQTGVDRGALDAALDLEIPIIGWMPKGRLAFEPIPHAYDPYLKEMNDENCPELVGLDPTNRGHEVKIYEPRTERNAAEGNGTLVIVQNAKEAEAGGTLYTIKMAQKHNKPVYVLDLSKEKSIDGVAKWIRENNIRDLNVGGPNEGKSKGVYEATKKVVKEILLHPELQATEQPSP